MKNDNKQEIINAINAGCIFEVISEMDKDIDGPYSEIYLENNSLYTTDTNGIKLLVTEDMLKTLNLLAAECNNSAIYYAQFGHIPIEQLKPLLSEELNHVIVHLEQIGRKILPEGYFPNIKIKGTDNSLINTLNFKKDHVKTISIGHGGFCTSEESYIEYYPNEDKITV